MINERYIRSEYTQQEVLGRTNHLFPFSYNTDRVQNDASNNSIVGCTRRGNVFTEPLPINDRTHIRTYRHIVSWMSHCTRGLDRTLDLLITLTHDS
jgi:hypothetical protein